MSKHARLSAVRSKLTGRNLMPVVIVAGCCALAGPTFIVLFMTVTHLLNASFDGWAWTVPVSTEAGYAVVYLADIYLEMRDRPARWLRYVSLPFVGASLWLNVYAADGRTAAMVGHAVVTLTFFGTLAIAKMCARRLIRARTEKERRDRIPLAHWLADPSTFFMWRRMVLRNVRSYALAVELEDARRLARDLARAHYGTHWKREAPRLLRAAIRAGRLGDAVTSAAQSSVRLGVTGGWEEAVRTMVVKAVTEGDKLTVTVRRERKRIDRQDEKRDDRQEPPRKTVSKPVSASAKRRAKVAELLASQPPLTVAQIVAKSGASESTVTRVKRDLADQDKPVLELAR